MFQKICKFCAVKLTLAEVFGGLFTCINKNKFKLLIISIFTQCLSQSKGAGGCCGIKFLTLVCRLQNCSNELVFRRHLLNSNTLKLYLLGPSVNVTINHQQRLFSFIFKSVKNPTRRVVIISMYQVLLGKFQQGPCLAWLKQAPAPHSSSPFIAAQLIHAVQLS